MKKDRDQASHQTDKRYSVPLNSTSADWCSTSSWLRISSRTGAVTALSPSVRATAPGMEEVNGTRGDPGKVLANLRRCGELAPTWVQTCLFRRDGAAPAEAELTAYLELLAQAGERLRGVHLYGLARPSLQPGAERLERLSPTELEAVAVRIRALGLPVTVSP